jgi:septum formation protein
LFHINHIKKGISFQIGKQFDEVEYVCWTDNTLHEFLMKLVLGSESPRRKELLSTLGFQFRTLRPNADETIPEEISIEQVPIKLAELKANILLPELFEDETIVCADTIVVLNNQIIGKPINFDHAVSILTALSGKTHCVYTGVSIKNHRELVSFVDKTEVTFTELSLAQIEYYVREFKPFDKAGAYGIQDWIGATAVEKINGSYTNVMGLPTCRLRLELDKLNIS